MENQPFLPIVKPGQETSLAFNTNKGIRIVSNQDISTISNNSFQKELESTLNPENRNLDKADESGRDYKFTKSGKNRIINKFIQSLDRSSRASHLSSLLGSKFFSRGINSSLNMQDNYPVIEESYLSKNQSQYSNNEISAHSAMGFENSYIDNSHEIRESDLHNPDNIGEDIQEIIIAMSSLRSTQNDFDEIDPAKGREFKHQLSNIRERIQNLIKKLDLMLQAKSQGQRIDVNISKNDLSEMLALFQGLGNKFEGLKKGNDLQLDMVSMQKIVKETLEEFQQLAVKLNDLMNQGKENPLLEAGKKFIFDENLINGKILRSGRSEKTDKPDPNDPLKDKGNEKNSSEVEKQGRNIREGNINVNAHEPGNKGRNNNQRVENSSQALVKAGNLTGKIITNQKENSDANLKNNFQNRGYFSDFVKNAGENNNSVKGIRKNFSQLTKTDIKQVIDQIIQKAKLIEQGDGKFRFSANLKPGWLGRLTFQVDYNKGNMVGKFLVESNELKDLLQANLNTLKKELLDTGLDIQEFEVIWRQDKGYQGLNYKSRDREESENYLPSSEQNFQAEIVKGEISTLKEERLLDLHA